MYVYASAIVQCVFMSVSIHSVYLWECEAVSLCENAVYLCESTECV